LKYLPPENHFIGKCGTVNIERNNLNSSRAFEKIRTPNNLFFKERTDARCRDKDLHPHSNQKQHTFETRPKN